MIELAALTTHAVAAVTAYGTAVLSRVQDDAADASVSYGRRLLRTLTGRTAADGGEDGGAEPTAAQAELARTVTELAADPGDEETRVMLRGRIRRILAADPQLAAEIASWPRPPDPPAATAHAEGERSVAIGGNAYGSITTGDATPRPEDRP